jgi:predicted glutamine amidotransferase
MCVIGVKRSGLLLPSNIERIMQACFLSNRDGAGFAIKRAGKSEIFYHKGLMTINDFLAAFRNLGTINAADEFVMHFRIRTAGLTDQKMTHPFIISSDFNEVSGTKGTRNSGESDKPVLFHNGMIHSFDGTNPRVSDTFNFTHQFMSKFKPSLKNRALVKWQKQLKKYSNGQKLAIMFPGKNEELELLGTYYEHENMFYSNTGWKYNLDSRERNLAYAGYI